MNRNIFIVLAVVLCAAMAYTDCTQHPMRGYILATHKIVNKGFTCFTEGVTESGCFSTDVVKVADMFVQDNVPVASNNEICKDVTNTCVDPAKVKDYMDAWARFGDTYHQALINIFDYKADEDTAVKTLITQFRDYIVEQTNTINLPLTDDTLGGLIMEYVEIDPLVELVKDVVTQIFEKLKEFAAPAVEGLNPVWKLTNAYAQGMACIVADADLDTAYPDAVVDGKIKINSLLFKHMDNEVINSYTEGALAEWVDNIREDILDYYKKVTGALDTFVEKNVSVLAKPWETAGKTHGIMTKLAKIDLPEVAKEKLQAGKLFVTIVEKVFSCMFPTTPEGYCVPFLDEIKWIVEGMKMVFQGDFTGFRDYFGAGYVRPGAPLVTTASLGSEVAFLASTLPDAEQVDGQGNGIDIVARSQSSHVSVNTPAADPENDDMITLFGKEFKQKHVFMAAGGLGAFLILMILICACCCRSKPAYPPMMGGMAPMQMGGMAPSMGGPPSMGMHGPPGSFGPARGMGGPPSMGMGMRGRPF